MQQNLLTTLRHYLADPEAGWSIGSFGAIAEFFWDAGETVLTKDLDGLTLLTERGGMRLRIDGPLRPIAYEALSGDPRRWQQGLAICLPEDAAQRGCRTTLTELGPDAESIRPQDREAVLFDLGLGISHVDACVRTQDPELLAALRAHCGQPILADNPAMTAVIHHSPQRVFISALGRIEVYQKIGLTVTPEGPHTHVLPKLLAAGRTHSANIPIPSGYLPCLTLHPANPLVDKLGRPRPFDSAQHAAFQELLASWGIPEYVAEKRRVMELLARGESPADYYAPTSGLTRTALRIALRQWAQIHGEDPSLQAWRQVFDRGNDREHDVDAH